MNTLHKPLADHVAETGKTFSYAAMGTLCLAAFLCGLAWPTTERTYDLVERVGEETAVIDHDLSATDCGFAADHLKRQGLTVECEAVASIKVE